LTFLGASGVPCSCVENPEAFLESSNVDANGSDKVAFRQAVRGAVLSNEGEPLWPIYLEYEGRANRDEGELSYAFIVPSPDGPRWYEGTGFLATATPGEHGSVTYQFVGGYSLRQDNLPVTGLPAEGRVVATVSVWEDGTLFGASFTFLEASELAGYLARNLSA
jgi:hypothetical protein